MILSSRPHGFTHYDPESPLKCSRSIETYSGVKMISCILSLCLEFIKKRIFLNNFIGLDAFARQTGGRLSRRQRQLRLYVRHRPDRSQPGL